MYALLMSVALLGEINPLVRDLLNEDTSRSVIQKREEAAQRQIAAENQEEERKNTYIIAGAIVAGLALLGLLVRRQPRLGGLPRTANRKTDPNFVPLWIGPPEWMDAAGRCAILVALIAFIGWAASSYDYDAALRANALALLAASSGLLGVYWLNRTTLGNRRRCRCPGCGSYQQMSKKSQAGEIVSCGVCKAGFRVPRL